MTLDDQLSSLAVKANKKPSKLPHWPDDKRGVPNSILRSALFSSIQSKDRIFLKEATLYSQSGITIKYSGEQLNQEDLALWETLVHLARHDPLGNVCTFSAYSILKTMGLATGGDQHTQLYSGIIRLNACSVQINHGGRTYFGSLIEGGTKDESTGHYKISLNRQLIRLYSETTWTAINCQQRLELRRKPLALALFGYYSSHAKPYPITLNFIQQLTGGKNKQKADFKRKCRVALDELVRIEFLESYNIDDDLVHVIRATKARH